MNSEHAVILVDSTSHALCIEKLLINRGFACRLIPVPRHLSSDCGVCVRILSQDIEKIELLMSELKISLQSIEVI